MPGWNEKRARLFYVVEKVAAEAEVELESIVLYGDPAEELMMFAEEKGCDVIVIGSSGKGRMNVITSYSIHYTKLYDNISFAKRHHKFAFRNHTLHSIK